MRENSWPGIARPAYFLEGGCAVASGFPGWVGARLLARWIVAEGGAWGQCGVIVELSGLEEVGGAG